MKWRAKAFLWKAEVQSSIVLKQLSLIQNENRGGWFVAILNPKFLLTTLGF